jgi:hypothetical protein
MMKGGRAFHFVSSLIITRIYLPLHKKKKQTVEGIFIDTAHTPSRSSNGVAGSGSLVHSVHTGLITVSEWSTTMAPSLLQDRRDGVQSMVQILKGWTEREPDKVVAGRVEQVSTVGRVDVEEDPGDHDRLLFKEFLEECLK